jgi:hypothetical protein
MTFKIALGALAVVAALGIGAPAFADDNDMNKPADQSMPHHHAMHHHAMHHQAMHEHHMAHHAAHHMHHNMSQDAKERAETKRLNEEQAHKGSM